MVKEELLTKNDRLLQMEQQVEELTGLRSKNKKLDDNVKALKKEIEALKRDKAEWESEQVELLLQRERETTKRHPQLQQDLNQSGLSNLSGFALNSRVLDESDSAPQLVSRMTASIEHPGTAQQLLVLEKQRFNSLEKLTGGPGTVSSTTGGGPNKGSHKPQHQFIQK